MKRLKMLISYLFASEKNLIIRSNREITDQNEIEVIGSVLRLRYTEEGLSQACEKYLG